MEEKQFDVRNVIVDNIISEFCQELGRHKHQQTWTMKTSALNIGVSAWYHSWLVVVELLDDAVEVTLKLRGNKKYIDPITYKQLSFNYNDPLLIDNVIKTMVEGTTPNLTIQRNCNKLRKLRKSNA